MILPMSCHHVSGGLVSARQYSVFDDWKLTHLSRLVYRWEMTVPCCYVADKPELWASLPQNSLQDVSTNFYLAGQRTIPFDEAPPSRGEEISW